MSRPRVYISGPITKGNRNEHYFRAAEIEKALMLSGFAPLNPMRSITLPFAWQENMPHDLWLAVDLAWIEACDAVVRLPGESKGADEECDFATSHGIPIFHCSPRSAGDLDAAIDRCITNLEQWRRNVYRRPAGVA